MGKIHAEIIHQRGDMYDKWQINREIVIQHHLPYGNSSLPSIPAKIKIVMLPNY